MEPQTNSPEDKVPNILQQKKWGDTVTKKQGLQGRGAGLTIIAQPIQSSNYVPQVSGWKIDSNGNADLNAVSVNMNGGQINLDGGSIINADYVSGTSGGIDFNNPGRIEVSTYFDPPDGGTYNLGGATRYWGDVSYKTLTDRGCLGWYDEGVELQDGRKVSDLEALKEIKPHPTRKTPAGRVRLDYSTLPKDVYVIPKNYDGTPYDFDEETGEYYSDEFDKKTGKIKRFIAQEGAETTALISILLGSIKELATRVETLEAEVANLKGVV